MATVSRAVRGLPNVSPNTRRKVLEAAEALRYRADPNASRLAAGKTGLVVMAVPSITPWYMGQAVAGVEAVLSAAGLELSLVFLTDDASRKLARHEPGSLAHGADALVLLDVAPDPDALDSPVPMVVVGVDTERFDSVSIDNIEGGALAGRHIASLGHLRFGLIGGSPDDIAGAVGRERLEGFRSGFAEVAGPIGEESSAFGNFSALGGYEAMLELLDRPRPPTAVFAVSDEMAMGAMRAVEDRGVSASGRPSIVGFDDHELAFAMGLTTVAQDPADMGAVGAGRLLSRLDGERDAPVSLHGDVHLVVRQSTRTC